MKQKGFFLSLAVVAMFLAPAAPALTFEELAGTYVGQRTEYTPLGVRRFEEVDVFKPDGTLTSFVFVDGVMVFSSLEFLQLDGDGRFYTSLGQGVIKLHGKHLEITGYFPTYATTVTIKERRTDKPAHWQR